MKIGTGILILLFALVSGQIGCSESNAGGSDAGGSDSTNVKSATDDKKGKNKKKKNDERVPVEIVRTSRGDISSYLLLSSNLETERMADVYSRVQGIVEEIYVDEGDYVQKGKQLMKLEADEYALNAAGAKVNFEQQKAAYERAKALLEKKLLSKEEFESTKYTMENARIEWQKSKLNVKYTKIESPISGILGERLVRPGDRIQPSDKIFSVINTQEIIAIVHVPEKEIGRVKKGQKAFITSSNMSADSNFPAWIKRVSPVVDPQSGTFKVTLGIRNEANKLRPGMFVNTHIITDVHKDAVLIPKTALVYQDESAHIFVVRNDSIAHKIKLQVGYENYQYIEALSAIEHGEKIVVVGQEGMKDKSKIKIVAERE